jgi:hypothetical protein
MPDQSPITANSGVSRYTLERIKPHLRGELDRRILAIARTSADQIGADRQAVIESTLRRFVDWVTTMPTDAEEERGAENNEMPETLVELPLEERRRQVMLHQGIRFSASLSEMLAIDAGALAMVWRTTGCDGSDHSPDHRQRDDRCYALRESWALSKGLMRAGQSGYYDEITSVSEEHNCRCGAKWIYSVRDLPEDMITPKGKSELARAKAEIERLRGSK